MRNIKISVLGGGVGGLGTAIALKQKGFDVDVYERDSETTNIGAGIVCWPNASFVLGELGILERVQQVSGRPARMERFSKEGESLGFLDIQSLDEQMGYASYSILRRDLMRLLVSRLADLGVGINYSHDLVGIETDSNNKAIARFNNGRSVEADVLIGADGRMNSIAREYIRADNRPVFQGFINWIGVFESKEPVFEKIAVGDYWGVGERFGVVPINSTAAYWAGGVAAREIGGRDPDSYKKELLAIFKGWPDPISLIINETPAERINKIYVHDHDPTDVWHKNNVLMIGDAAHAPLPTSGQGACQALEDAWHLANVLQQDFSDITSAFTRFTELRQAKTTSITLGARQFASSLFNTDPEYCRQRNNNSAQTDYAVAVQGMARGWASGLPIGLQS